MPNVVVVGGGLIGSCLAYELVSAGQEVLLVDRRDYGQATYAGAGILSPASSRWSSLADVHFAYDASTYYRSLIPKLEADGGGDTGYSSAEVMVIAGEGDELDKFQLAKLDLLGNEGGDEGHVAMQAIGVQDAKARFPALGKVSGALLDDRGARVDGSLLQKALLRAAASRGLQVVHDGVDNIEITRGRVTGVAIRGEVTGCDRVVLAAGAWSSQFLATVGLKNCVAPMRGQICHLEWDRGVTGEWAVVVGLRGHYLLPRASGRIVAGATREEGSGLAPDLTAGGCYEVLQEALRLAPGLATAKVVEWRIGLRPVSQDTHPILGKAPGIEGCYLATGHGAAGLLLGPWSAHLVSEEVLGRTTNVEDGPYRAGRFAL